MMLLEEGGSYYVGYRVEETAKVKVLEACVVPACVHRLGTLALNERQEEKLQVGEYVN